VQDTIQNRRFTQAKIVSESSTGSPQGVEWLKESMALPRREVEQVHEYLWALSRLAAVHSALGRFR
jgi:hypothetical protein